MCLGDAYIKQINIVQGACGQLLIVDGHILYYKCIGLEVIVLLFTSYIHVLV